MSMAGQYETAYEVGQRRGRTDSVVCRICGAFVIDIEAHDGWHARLAAHWPSLSSVRPYDRANPETRFQ